ncbi:MAG: DNA-deoxyinosine glycosylase [Clostridia bacterium]|nr:DNA-deoxyinosine glycosylase [Clostridia bacterium]
MTKAVEEKASRPRGKAAEAPGKQPVFITHPFAPLFDENSRVLILGSFPSVKSRDQRFYYGHPQNRFWKVLAALYHRDVPESIPEKRALILENSLALWDSIAACEITGSSDASIRNAKPNDLQVILGHAPIRLIVCNGKASFQCYETWIRPRTGREALCLPSTSPANAQWSLARLTEAWSVIL